MGAAAAAAALPAELAPAWTGDAPSKRTLGGGIVIEDTALGEGREARHASSVDVAYEAFVLREDGAGRGTAIDRATARDPYGFVVGSGDVIRGLSEGVKGMRPGGRRVITVPWQYAYGAKGRPPRTAEEWLALRRPLLEVGAGFEHTHNAEFAFACRMSATAPRRAPEPDAELRVRRPVRGYVGPRHGHEVAPRLYFTIDERPQHRERRRRRVPVEQALERPDYKPRRRDKA